MPNRSIVFVFGVAVNATNVIPESAARVAIWEARMSSMLTSPPSPISLISSGESTALSLAAASPAWELWASSAMTANRFPFVADISRTASSAKGNVWIVQTTIFLSPDRAPASSPLLLALSPVTLATTPVVRSKSKRASWS